MVVAAHPDDEVLGPGATLHRLVAGTGCTVRVLILGEGLTSRAGQRDRAAWRLELAQHQTHAEQARVLLGYQELRLYDFPDNRFDGVELLDMVKAIEGEKADFRPDFVFTHHGGDVNVDHRCCYDAVMAACRPLPGETVRGVFSFEIPSSTEWQFANHPIPWRPNFFVGIGEADLEAKVAAMEAYVLERRPYPHPRSPEALRALAQRYGVMTGQHLAEAFMLLRQIEPLT
ncbi:MAG: PIG-L family deacetylase [Bacteroidia bacterium]